MSVEPRQRARDVVHLLGRRHAAGRRSMTTGRPSPRAAVDLALGRRPAAVLGDDDLDACSRISALLGLG